MTELGLHNTDEAKDALPKGAESLKNSTHFLLMVVINKDNMLNVQTGSTYK